MPFTPWRPSVGSPRSPGTVSTGTDGPACWKPSLLAEIYQHTHTKTRTVDRQRNLLNNGFRLVIGVLPDFMQQYLSVEGKKGTVPLVNLKPVQPNAIIPKQSVFREYSSFQFTHCKCCVLCSATPYFQCWQKSPLHTVFMHPNCWDLTSCGAVTQRKTSCVH